MHQDPYAEHVELLQRAEVFAGLDRVTLAKVAARLLPEPIEAGTALITQGDPSDSMYLICSGSFGVYVSSGEGTEETLLGHQRRGDILGEMGLLTGEPRSATVRAEEQGEVLRLERAHFLALMQRDPSVALAVAATLSRRLRATSAARAAPSSATEPQRQAPAPPAEPTVAAAMPQARASAAPAARSVAARRLLGLGATLLVLAIGRFSPPPEGLSSSAWFLLSTLVALVPLMTFEVVPEAAIALIASALWVLGGVAPTGVALGGYASSSWLLILTVFAIGGVIGASGLLYRLAVTICGLTRDHFSLQVAALGVTGLLAGAAVPTPNGRAALVAPATSELAEALGYEPNSDRAAGLAMAMHIGFGQMVAPFLTSSTTAVLAYALLPDASQVGVNWVSWLVRALPAHLVLLGGLIVFVALVYRTDVRAASVVRRAVSALGVQRALLGPPTRQEWIAALAALFMLSGFVSQPLHRVDPGWIGVATFVLLAAAGTLTADSLRGVNWSFVLLFGMLASVADVSAYSGLDRWLGDRLAELLGSLVNERLLFIGVLTLICFGVTLFLRREAAVPLLTIALAPLAVEAEMDPWIIAFVALLACGGFLLPYQNSPYLALFQGTGGKLFSHRQARPTAFAYLVLTVVALAVSVPYWRGLGLL